MSCRPSSLYVLWQIAEPMVLTAMIKKNLPAEMLQLSANEFSLVLNDIRNVVAGNTLSGDRSPGNHCRGGTLYGTCRPRPAGSPLR